MNVFELFATINLDTSGYTNALNDASSKTSSFGDKLKNGLATAAKVGAAAIGAATTAAAAFAASSVKVGSEFDASMSQVAATMGVTVDSIQNLRDFALEMGSTTAFSASQAAGALNYMALAGYDAETSMAMLPNVLNLAAAGGIDLAYASDMITDSQSALGLTLDETSQLVDKMAKTSSKSNTSIAQLGEAILTVGGTAKNLAGGTTELSTALGILADNGVKGAEGGTALRNIILSLGAPTDKAAKLMASFGLEVYDAEGNMRPLNETFGDLNAVLSTMTQGEQTQVLNSIFNKVDLKSVNALLANTAGEIGNVSTALESSGVDWAKYAGTALASEEGFKDLIETIRWSIEDMGVKGGELQELLYYEFGIDFEDAVLAIEAVDAALTENGNRWDELSVYIDNATDSAQNMADVQLDNLAGDITMFKSALEGAQIVLSDQISPTLREFVQFGTNAISTLSDAFKEGGLSGAMEALGTILSDGLKMVVEQVPKMADAGMQLLGALGRGLLDNFPVITKSAVEIIKVLASGLNSALPEIATGAVEIISELAASLAEALPQLIPAAVEAVLKFAENLTNPESTELLMNASVALINGLIQGLVAAVPYLVEYTPAIVANLTMALLQGVPKIVEVGVQLIAGLIEGMILKIGSIPQAIENVVDSIVGGFKAMLGIHTPSTVFFDIGGMLVQGLINGIGSAWSGLTNFVRNLVNNLVGGVKSLLGIHSPSKVFAGIGENMALGLEKGWDDEYADIKRTIENGLDFGAASLGLTANYTGAAETAQDGAQTGFGGMGNTTINIYNPEKRDAITEAREWKKTVQRMAIGYV